MTMTAHTQIRTKKITFDNVMKEFKKYISKDDTRKILNYVYFDGTHFIATNSHILLKVNSEYVSDIPDYIEKGSMYDPVNLMPYEDTLHRYPDTSRLVPNEFNLTLRINKSINEIQSLVKLGHSLVKGKQNEKLTRFTVQDDYMVIEAINKINKQPLEVKNESIIKHNDYLHSNGKEIQFLVRNEYLLNMLVTSKKLSKLSNQDMKFNIKGSMQPITICQDDVFTLLVLPVRMT